MIFEIPGESSVSYRHFRSTAAALVALSSVFALEAKSEEGVPLRGFSDMSYVYDSTDDSQSFRIGLVDFFLAKPIDAKTNFLVELGLEPSYAGVGIDLERSYVQYVVGPWLKVSVGRFHTALGYWNDTYHHGGYLQTSVSRPVMERFEDNGGLLPTRMGCHG